MSKKYRVCITQEECKGCTKNLIDIGNELNKQGYFSARVEHPEDCIGCGSCFLQCPEPGAITIYQTEE